MTAYAVNNFGGLAPKVGVRALAANMAQTALNCKLWSRELRPWKVPLTVATPSKVGTMTSIYRFSEDHATDDNYWFHWTQDVNVVRGPIAGDTSERTYFTGAGGVPQVTDSAIALTAGTAYPMNSYNLGLPIPAAPTATLGTGGAGTAVSKAYVVTYVSAYGEEGPPSLPSNIVAAMPDQIIDLSAIPVGPGGAYQITGVNIYRANTGASGTDYQFVASVAIGVTAYSDTTDDDDLGAVILTTTFIAPPAAMIGLVALPNGIHAGFYENTLCLSEPFLPHAYPTAYQQAVDYGIVGLGVLGTSIVICTTGIPYLASGTTSSNYSALRLRLAQACVSKRSIVSGDFGVMYASPDGLVLVDEGGARVATEALFARDEWALLVPSSISGYFWSGKYVGFYNTGTVTGGFIYDPRESPEKSFTFISTYATAGYFDAKRGNLYLMIGPVIQKWDGGATNMTYTWKSKQFTHGRKLNMGVVKVDADSYPVTVLTYADGTLKDTISVTSSKPQKLTAGFKSRVWEFAVTGTSNIKIAGIAEVTKNLNDLSL